MLGLSFIELQETKLCHLFVHGSPIGLLEHLNMRGLVALSLKDVDSDSLVHHKLADLLARSHERRVISLGRRDEVGQGDLLCEWGLVLDLAGKRSQLVLLQLEVVSEVNEVR